MFKTQKNKQNGGGATGAARTILQQKGGKKILQEATLTEKGNFANAARKLVGDPKKYPSIKMKKKTLEKRFRKQGGIGSNFSI